MVDQQREFDASPTGITLSPVPTTLGLHPLQNTDVDMISPCPDILEDLVSQLLISNADASTQTDLHLLPSADIKIIIQPNKMGSTTSCISLTPPPSPKADSSTSSKRPTFCKYCRRKGHLIEECRTRERNNRRKAYKKRRLDN